MADRPLRLGPDPNRTHMERWNQMHPDRYGRPDTAANQNKSSPRWFKSEDSNYYGPGLVRTPGNEVLDAMVGLVILSLAAVIGFAFTITTYRLTHPDNLTAAWVFGYVGMFVASSFVTALLLYAVRRIVLAMVLSVIAFGIGYAAWHLWLT